LVASAAKSYSVNSETLKQAKINLSIITEKERKAELTFLKNRLKIDERDLEEYGEKDLIEKFNKVLSLKSTYETNINRILHMKEK